MDYQEKTETVTSWVRSNLVRIDNRLNATPSMIFSQEKAMKLPDGSVITQPLDNVSADLSDPTRSFKLLNPVTGEDAGEAMTYAEVYAALYSLYLDLVTPKSDPQPETPPASDQPPAENPPVE
jgi:hypothetical protein